MRSKERIYEFCNKLAVIWAENAQDWRFGQLMCNVLGAVANEGKDPFFIEEDKMIKYFEEYFNR